MGKKIPYREQVAILQQEIKLLQEEARQSARMKRLWQQSNNRLKKARAKQLALQCELENHIVEIENARALLESIASNDKAIVENMSEGIMITSPEGIIMEVNPAFEKITGYSAEQAVGQNTRLLSSGQHDEMFFTDLWRQLKENSIWKGEITNRNALGDVYIQETSISEVKDWNGNTVSYVAVLQDVTRRRHDEDTLKELALYDNLTGLANRRLFREQIQTMLHMAHRRDVAFAILFIDLDGFKPVNDRLGHEAGDFVLVEFARRLQRSLRESDAAGRYGGDEFTMLLSVVDSIEDAETAACRLLEKLREPIVWCGHEICIDASIGVSMFPQDGEDCQALIASADSRMYRAKHGGKGSICLRDE